MLFRYKKMIGILLPIFLISCVISSVPAYEEKEDNIVYLTITVESYKIMNNEDGQEVVAENFGRLLVPGKPSLPSKIFSITIPPDAEVADISFETGKSIILPGTYDISPVPLPSVICEEDPRVREKEERVYKENYNMVYSSDDPYPSAPVEFVRNAHYRKYNLVDVRVSPFSYKPISQELSYYSEITVYVIYRFPGNIDIINDNLPRTEERAEKIVANYDEAKSWYPKTIGQTIGVHDYVIVTLDSLTSAITPLVNWESSKGRTAQVVTTSWIDSNYNGYDLAEKIRNFLRDKYPSNEWGIEDVLLVGHRDDLPMRRTWQDTGYGKPETDFYYAELSLPDNQSWDADGDHRWGETYGDNVDMYSEINVGRIPWSDPGIVTSICDKSVAYEQNNDPSFKKNILLLGAFFWPDTDNAVLMELKTNPTIHPWMVDWTSTKLYEQPQSSYPSDYNLDYNNAQNVWSSGTYGFVNWAGHGSPTACFEYYPSQAFVDTATCAYLNDDYPAIIFADACSNSDTDYTNIGMKMLEQGGVGFLGATKVAYGYHGWDDPYDGASSSMDYFFTTCVTSGDYTQGQAHQYALAEMYTYGLWYYPLYETFEWGALWGNPDLGMEYYPSFVDINITSVKVGWNFISLPFHIPELTPSVSKYSLTIKSNDGLSNYNWSDAVTAGLIDTNIFGWDRTGQMYVFTDMIEPGYGYWLYAYEDCEIWAENITLAPNNEITVLQEKWNLMGSAHEQSININDIIVNHVGTDYTWAEAIDPSNGPIVDPNVFGWDRIGQSYVFSDILEPGHAYWIYSYEECTMILPVVS